MNEYVWPDDEEGMSKEILYSGNNLVVYRDHFVYNKPFNNDVLFPDYLNIREIRVYETIKRLVLLSDDNEIHFDMVNEIFLRDL